LHHQFLHPGGVSLASTRELYHLPRDDLAQRVSFAKFKVTAQVLKGAVHTVDVFWLKRSVLK
jgi:hypothetical protein